MNTPDLNQAAIDEANKEVQSALGKLRQAMGLPPDDPCRFCEGSGKYASITSDQEGDCPYCHGTGRQKRTYPMAVVGIEWGKAEALQPPPFNRGTTWVSVRPCDEECKGQTYLGWLLGEIALGQYARLRPDGILEVSMGMHNPAIFVPDLGRVVYGCGSWWAAIKSLADLRKITNKDIDNVWYVKALKDLGAATDTEPPPTLDV